MKGNDNDSVINKLTNRQLKLKVLVDEAAVVKNEAKAATNAPKDKRIKCGQCEKKIAFTVNYIIFNYKAFFNSIINLFKEMS